MIEIKPETKCATCQHRHRDHTAEFGCSHIARPSLEICSCRQFVAPSAPTMTRPDAVRTIANAVLSDLLARATDTALAARVRELPIVVRQDVYTAIADHATYVKDDELDAAFARLEREQ